MPFINCDFLDYSIRPKIKNSAAIEMSEFESAYIAGLIGHFKPENIIEVGVSAGGTSVLILKSLFNNKMTSRLVSVDLNTQFYKNRSMKTGYVVDEEFVGLENWTLYTGKYLPEIATEFTKKFDFAIIDTTHSLPGEVLDYLAVLKYMNLGGIVVFHNLHLYFTNPQNRNAWATKLLYDACVGNKIYCEDKESGFNLPNIAGFQITPDTFKYGDNVFSLLSMAWNYMIPQREFDIYYNFFKANYSPVSAYYFKLAYENNRKLFAYNDRLWREKTIKIKKEALEAINDSFLAQSPYEFKPKYSTMYNWLMYHLFPDNWNIHYEVSLHGDKVRVSLHCENENSNLLNLIEKVMKNSRSEDKLCLINNKFGTPCVGCFYELEYRQNPRPVIKALNYLIFISYNEFKDAFANR